MEWSELPWGELTASFSQRHPLRCLWCGIELQSNQISRRRAFIEEHSHDDFPAWTWEVEMEFTEAADSGPEFPKYELRQGTYTYTVERTGLKHWTGWVRKGDSRHRTAVTKFCASEKEAMQQVIAHITGDKQEEAGEMTTSQRTRMRVSLDLIDDNPYQPRAEITPESAEEMADDIRRIGRILQTPLSRPSPAGNGRYELAFGHRRIRGCRLLRQTGEWEDDVELDVEDLTDEQMALIALSENVARRQLTGLEIARAWKKAIDDTDLTVNTLAEKVGVSHSAMSNHLRVLELPALVLEARRKRRAEHERGPGVPGAPARRPHAYRGHGAHRGGNHGRLRGRRYARLDQAPRSGPHPRSGPL